jgi:adenylyl-sulfate kinase
VTDDVVEHPSAVSRADRIRLTGGGSTIWLTGLSGSGKSSVAHRAEAILVENGRPAYVLDGDNLRMGLNGDLGFSADDRSENVRRTGEVARLMADAGLLVFVPLISPYSRDRQRVRRLHEADGIPFHEVHVATPLEVCEARDAKGLYARARAGEITGFTGIDDPYEEPADPDLVIDTADSSVDDSARLVLGLLPGGWPPGPPPVT